MKWILCASASALTIFIAFASHAATYKTPGDPTIPNAVAFEGVVYEEADIRALVKAYGVKSSLLHYQCDLPIKRAISDASACRVRCSDQGTNILDVFALDRLISGKTEDGRQLLIISRSENHDGVKENGGIAILNATASCFFQGLKLIP